MHQTILITPLNKWHHEHGANMVNFGGWDMPLWYETGAVKEHLVVIESAGLFDTSHMSVILVDGPGAFDLLQYCFTKDLEACIGKEPGPLTPGRCVYGAFLSEEGHALDDALVYRLGPDHFMIVVNANMGSAIADHLKTRQDGKDVHMSDLTGKIGKMDLQGPLAGKIIKQIIKDPDTVLTQMPYFSFKGHFDAASPLAVVRTRDGIPILLSRTGYTGEFGFEIFVNSNHSLEVWNALLEAGRAYGLTPCGLAARDSLRAGAVLPLSHQDIGAWPFINHTWSFALPFDVTGRSFTKSFLGEKVLDQASTTEHTLAFAGYDPRKVSLHGPSGEPALVLDEDDGEIGVVLTCVADMALGRVDGKIYSLADPAGPEGFKARGLICGFVRVKESLEPGTVIFLKDNRRRLKVEITQDVRPLRTARRPMNKMI
jgi:aminomethyltransferase